MSDQGLEGLAEVYFSTLHAFTSMRRSELAEWVGEQRDAQTAVLSCILLSQLTPPDEHSHAVKYTLCGVNTQLREGRELDTKLCVFARSNNTSHDQMTYMTSGFFDVCL